MTRITNQSNWSLKNIVEDIEGKLSYLFGEKNTEPSQTIPNQTMSLQDMVDQFTVSSNWPKTPTSEQFDSETPLPDIQNMDKTEIAALQLNIKNDIIDYQSELKEIQENVKIQKAKQKEIEDTPIKTPEKEIADTPQKPPEKE